MAVHSFDPEIAAKVGVNAAVLYQNIMFWCEKNRLNEKHIHDGKAWTYNSRQAWAGMFPYFTEKQVRVALDKLRETGLVEVGNFSGTTYNRTTWYHAALKGECIGPKGPNEMAERANPLAQKGQTITDSKPDIKPDIYMDEFEIWWRDLVPERDGPNPKKVARERYIKFRKKGVSKDAIWNATHEYRNMLAANGTEPRFIKQAATWLNTEPWVK